jgi:hypothetical protein
MFCGMVDILRLIWGTLADFFRSRADLQTEIIALRHQLNVLRRKRPERLVFGNADRLLLVWLYRLAPATLNALSIVKPETVIGWHQQEFRSCPIPTVGDIPPITVRFVEALTQHGPFGAKGLGEAPLIPTPTAIANAIRRAVGINLTSLPILPHELIQPH